MQTAKNQKKVSGICILAMHYITAFWSFPITRTLLVLLDHNEADKSSLSANRGSRSPDTQAQYAICICGVMLVWATLLYCCVHKITAETIMQCMAISSKAVFKKKATDKWWAIFQTQKQPHGYSAEKYKALTYLLLTNLNNFIWGWGDGS